MITKSTAMIDDMLECIARFEVETIVTCNSFSVVGFLDKNDDDGGWYVESSKAYVGVKSTQRIIFNRDKVINVNTTKDLTNGDLLAKIEVRGQHSEKPAGFGERSHEECFDCAKREVEPPQCSGHVAGPSACPDFKTKSSKPKES